MGNYNSTTTPSQLEKGDVNVTIEQWDNGEIKTKTYSSDPNYTYHATYGVPARITYDKKGRVISQEWRQRDLLHREDDRPSIETYYYSSDRLRNIKSQEYLRHGTEFRVNDKPTNIEYDEYGCIKKAMWKKDSVLHRDGDKPAFIAYNDDGSVERKWFENGELKKETIGNTHN